MRTSKLLKHFTDDMGTPPADKHCIDAAIKRFWNQCATFFIDLVNLPHMSEFLQEVYKLVKHKVHILGLQEYSL